LLSFSTQVVQFNAHARTHMLPVMHAGGQSMRASTPCCSMHVDWKRSAARGCRAISQWCRKFL